MLSILLVIGRAGASPPSRTAAIIFLRVVRRALNLLRASFSPLFQYFSAVNVTRVSFSMVATIVLVVSNKPIQSSMNNTSSDSKVTMRVDETSLAWLTNPWRIAPCMAYKLGNIEISELCTHRCQCPRTVTT